MRSNKKIRDPITLHNPNSSFIKKLVKTQASK